MTVDALSPVAVSQRSGVAYQPGIGPHTESSTVRLVMERLSFAHPERYANFALGVPYGAGLRQACDLCLGPPSAWDLAVEVKMLRMLGDNGKPNDNILMHILSPYPAHRSALTDCVKLAATELAPRKGIIIYGYDYKSWPMDPAIEAFEALGEAASGLGPRSVASFAGLVHSELPRPGVGGIAV